MAKLSISEETLQIYAHPDSISRGEDYFMGGAVVDLVQRGNQIQAQVEGQQAMPYRVTLQTDAGSITKASCTCPYDFGGWCKHIVAAILTCLNQPDRIVNRPPLAQILDQLNPDQIQQLLQHLVDEHPELMYTIDRYVVLKTVPKSPSNPSTLDITPFVRQVHNIIRDAVRGMEEGYGEFLEIDALWDITTRAHEFITNGDWENGIAILTAVTQTCLDQIEEIEEYGGEDSIGENLDVIWTKAILEAEIDPSQRTDLKALLEEVQKATYISFAMSLTALEQGWHDPELQRVLQGKGYSDPDRLQLPLESELAVYRLDILERQIKPQEYLNLALANGLIEQYLTYLVKMGNIDQAMTAAKRITTADEAFALAQALRQSNHLPEALLIAQQGLQLPGNKQFALASWTVEFSEGLGHNNIALEASIIAFKLRPSFAEYRRAQSLGGSQWQTIQPELLQALRQSDTWRQEDKVDIFLHEGLVTDAIETVQHRYTSSSLVLRVMAAAITTNPQWVIERGKPPAEEIMNQGKSGHYDEAVKWLHQVKAAYVQLNQTDRWRSYFSHLQSQHSRKYKLMNLFISLR